MLNATTARFIAKSLGVFLKKSNGILIIGASEVSQLIARYLKDNNRHVVLIDSNQTNIANALNLGLDALTVDIYSDTLKDNIELNDIGYLMALTGSADINQIAIEKFKDDFGLLVGSLFSSLVIRRKDPFSPKSSLNFSIAI